MPTSSSGSDQGDQGAGKGDDDDDDDGTYFIIFLIIATSFDMNKKGYGQQYGRL